MSSLLICRDAKDLILLNRIRTGSGVGVVVASDDLRVQRAAKEDRRVARVMFIEQLESLFSVAEGVLEIRERINKWLVTRGPTIPSYLLEWIKWGEGGETTQRIQDALLLVSSYKVLLSNDITEVLLRRRTKTWWEDEILLETARSLGIATVEYKSLPYRLAKALGLVAVRRKFFWKEREFYIPQALVPFLEMLILFVRVSYSKLKSRKRAGGTGPKQVIFLVASSAEKHVDNAAIVMREFKRRKGFQPIALCWNALMGCKRIKQKGLDAENLECWFPTGATLHLLKTYWTVKHSCRMRYRDFEHPSFLSHKGIPIGKALLPFARKFIQNEFPSRLVFYFSAQHYLNENQPMAVRTWGENILDVGVIFYELLKEKCCATGQRPPLIFDYPVGLTVPLPYHNKERKPDLFLLSGEQDREIYEETTGDSLNAVVVGFGQDSKIKDFMSRFTSEESKEILRIPTLKKYNFFYAPSGIMRGYVSPGEHLSVATCLVEFAISVPSVLLIIKPHPSEAEWFWQDLLREYRPFSNVRLIDKKVSPYQCINVSDLVITKFSTLALEAMEFSKPVISIALDHERRFQDIFEDAVEKFTDIEPFISFLKDITSSRETFDAWAIKKVKAQNEFLPRKMHKSQDPVEKLIVDNVIGMLSRENHLVVET